MRYSKFYPNGWQSGQKGDTPITPAALNHVEAFLLSLINGFSAGDQIGVGADLNQYTKDGKYSVELATIAASLVNCPVSAPFDMFVFSAAVTGKTQLIIEKDFQLHFRSGGDAPWSEWGTLEGKIPVKGEDYYTPHDREEIVQDVLAALGTPVFGTVDDANNIVLSGNLAPGMYFVKYEDAAGIQSHIGSIAVGGVVNLADPKSSDWLTGYRINSSLAIVSDANSSSERTIVTNYIPAGFGETVRVEGLNIRNATSEAGTYVGTRALLYDSKKNVIGSFVPGDSSNCTEENEMWTCEINAALASADISQLAFVRFNGTLYPGWNAEDVVISTGAAN